MLQSSSEPSSAEIAAKVRSVLKHRAHALDKNTLTSILISEAGLSLIQANIGIVVLLRENFLQRTAHGSLYP